MKNYLKFSSIALSTQLLMTMYIFSSGVLVPFSKKNYKVHSVEQKNCIQEYFRDDGSSRICPGMNECISVRTSENKKIKLQKRMILYTLKELYQNYIQDMKPNPLPSFSFFASMRPKECVFPGSPGTHTMCVCSQHQNVKLKLTAINATIKYREIMFLSVCSMNDKKCMMRYKNFECAKCSKTGMNKIKEILKSEIGDNRTRIHYKNWDSTTYGSDKKNTRVTLLDFEEPVEDFLNSLSVELWNLTKHHFVSEQQKDFVKYQKENLKRESCIMLMDFAENYAFLCQDSTQGFYWNNTQATLHPMVVYYKDEHDVLRNMSFCIISDHMKHDASAVNVYQQFVLKILKELCPWIEEISYVSDGAPTQYKNK